MALNWTAVHAVLWISLYLFTENVQASPCAEVNSSSTLVPFGSAVTASCYIKGCQEKLDKNQDFLIRWKKNAHFIPSSKATEKNVNEVHISNFTDVQAVLECLICDQNNCNVVGGVVIKAAYPPPTPQNLTCQLYLNDDSTLVCMWDPGIKTSDIPTNYTLYTQTRDPSSPLKTLVSPPGENSFRVPRDCFIFFEEMKVYVVATNAFGQATSKLLVLDPMETAKLDAPLIHGGGTQSFGCLEYRWSLSTTQGWIIKTFHIEIKLKPRNGEIYYKEQLSKPYNKVKVCGLLHGMSYELQMRVRYKSSPWSEWSNATVVTTPMKAPTGRLVTWLKLQKPESRNQTAQLFWKQSLQFRPNSMNVSYTVSIMGYTKKKETVCVTDQQSCTFQIHAKVRKVSLTAINGAGKSNPTEVPVYRRRGMDPVPILKMLPQSEASLVAEWKSPDTPAISAYVLEWMALCGTNSNHVSFEIVDRNQTSFVVSGLEPYMPYEISVYPKYGGGIGQPYSTVAYTKEKAPSISPKLKIGKITPSLVELSWDEIPLQQRNGIITGYKIFYRDLKNNTGVIDTKSTTRHIVLKDLYPFTIYELFIMTSTQGGSVNGSTVTVKTGSFDAFEVFLIVIPACFGLALFFFGLLTCLCKQKWMKKYVWPVIPDPANSNIKKWTLADSLECMPPFKEVKDPSLMYLSHVSLLSLPEKELSKGDERIKSDDWPDNGKSVDSSHDSETFGSEQQSESVPYATVIFAGPYRRQPIPPPVYLRSESTQPLLEEEEPSSPRSYEQMTSQVNLPDVGHFSVPHKNLSAGEETASHWSDFPMLMSLETNIGDHAALFHSNENHCAKNECSVIFG